MKELFGGFEYRVLKVILSSCRTVEKYLIGIKVLLRLYIEDGGKNQILWRGGEIKFTSSDPFHVLRTTTCTGEPPLLKNYAGLWL